MNEYYIVLNKLVMFIGYCFGIVAVIIGGFIIYERRFLDVRQYPDAALYLDLLMIVVAFLIVKATRFALRRLEKN